MKKALLIMVAVIGFGFSANAQDVIVTKDGKKINAKVTEVNENDIRYKIYDDANSPSYFMKKSEISTILYEGGRVDVFNLNMSNAYAPQTQSRYSNNFSTDYFKKAKSLRNAGISCFSTGMAFTFPIGLSLLFTNYGYYDYYSGYYYYDYSQSAAGLSFIIMGPIITTSGIIMWAVGQTRMNRYNADGYSLFENKKVQLNLAVGGNSMGLKLNF